MPNYGDAKYWDDRYKLKETTFDWLENWSDIKDLTEKYAIGTTQKQSLSVLNLGCGNSLLPEDMYDEGYTNIKNMDISSVCIDQMRLRNEQIRPKMSWEVMDVRELMYPDASFDLIIDKSTIDALLCGMFAYVNVAIMMKECQRVLKTGGVYMAVSYGTPENRELHFLQKHLHFELKTFQIEKKHPHGPSSVHHVYICTKISNNHDENFPLVLRELKLEMEADQRSELNMVPSEEITEQLDEILKIYGKI